ncbi:MAG: hypothetical protein Q9208_007156 [Pyrenodesmia sp. 3 TL-2023]
MTKVLPSLSQLSTSQRATLSANAVTMLDGKDEEHMITIRLPHFEYRFHDLTREGNAQSQRQKETQANTAEFYRFLDDLRSIISLRMKLQQQYTRLYWCGYDTAPQTLWNQQMTNAAGKLNDLVLESISAERKIVAASGIASYMSFGKNWRGWIVESMCDWCRKGCYGASHELTIKHLVVRHPERASSSVFVNVSLPMPE